MIFNNTNETSQYDYNIIDLINEGLLFDNQYKNKINKIQDDLSALKCESFQDVVNTLQSKFKSIFGADEIYGRVSIISTTYYINGVATTTNRITQYIKIKNNIIKVVIDVAPGSKLLSKITKSDNDKYCKLTLMSMKNVKLYVDNDFDTLVKVLKMCNYSRIYNIRGSVSKVKISIDANKNLCTSIKSKFNNVKVGLLYDSITILNKK